MSVALELQQLAKHLASFRGSSVSFEPYVQSSRQEKNIPNLERARDALIKLEILHSTQPLYARVLWFAYGANTLVGHDEIALTFANTAQRAAWLTGKRKSLQASLPGVEGTRLLMLSVSAWDACDVDLREEFTGDALAWIIQDVETKTQSLRRLREELMHPKRKQLTVKQAQLKAKRKERKHEKQRAKKQANK